MDLELDLDFWVETPPKNWPQFGTHMVIKTLDGSCCKQMYKLKPQLHISGIHMKKLKKKKKTEFTAENGIDQ